MTNTEAPDLPFLAREVERLAAERADTEYPEDWVEYESYAAYVRLLRSAAAHEGTPPAGYRYALVCSVTGHWDYVASELLDKVSNEHPAMFEVPPGAPEPRIFGHSGGSLLAW